MLSFQFDEFWRAFADQYVEIPISHDGIRQPLSVSSALSFEVFRIALWFASLARMAFRQCRPPFTIGLIFSIADAYLCPAFPLSLHACLPFCGITFQLLVEAFISLVLHGQNGML